MLRAKVNPAKKIFCPTCLERDFVVFRRVPAGNSTIKNLCICKTCGEHFEYDEDKEGRAITTSAA